MNDLVFFLFVVILLSFREGYQKSCGRQQGNSIAELENDNIVWKQPSQILDQSIIRDHQNPFHSSGGLKLMNGNVGQGIIKVSALKNQNENITAPAKVFNNQEEVEFAFANGDLNKDCIIVVKGQGPSANGMPELHKLTAPLGVLQSRGHTVAILTDGRLLVLN